MQYLFYTLYYLFIYIIKYLNTKVNNAAYSLLYSLIIIIYYWILQMIGLIILGIGLWAWFEKDVFNNFSKFTSLDPAFVLICIGITTFIIGFTGSVGALRENTCLLATVSKIWNLFIIDAKEIYYKTDVFLMIFFM